MNMTGYLTNISISYTSGKPVLSFELEDGSNKEFRQAIESMMKGKLTIKIDKFRKNRSLDANAYLWKLCELIADKLSEDGAPHTKKEIYRDAIKARGIYRQQGQLTPEFAQTMRTAWEKLGDGWVTEQVDFEPDGEKVIVRFYYGSSTYNTKQMSRIVDYLVMTCANLQIETKSTEEIASLLQSWKGGAR